MTATQILLIRTKYCAIVVILTIRLSRIYRNNLDYQYHQPDASSIKEFHLDGFLRFDKLTETELVAIYKQYSRCRKDQRIALSYFFEFYDFNADKSFFFQ